MSTQTALSAVGYVVGAYFGYPQLGMVVGALVGAALTPKTKNSGPRLDDQKVTVSTYGAGIPSAYGTVRITGNTFWCTDKIENAQTLSSDGKGGGTENTVYKYYVHMAIGLCAGPVVAIRKIWKDGKLIYDMGTGASIATAVASESNPYSRAYLHTGEPDQLPDAFMELWMGGPGSVPAYRDLAYVLLQTVECPGGQIPQFSFEVLVNGGTAQMVNLTDPADIPYPDYYTNRFSYSRVPVTGELPVVWLDAAMSNTVMPGDTVQRKMMEAYVLGDGFATRVIQINAGDQAYNYNAVWCDQADIDAVCFRHVTASDYQDKIHMRVLLASKEVKQFQCAPYVFGQTSSKWAKRGNRIIFRGDGNQTDPATGLPEEHVMLYDWESAGLLGSVNIPWSTVIHITESYVWVFIRGNITPTLTVELRTLNSLDLISSNLLDVSYTGFEIMCAPIPGDALGVFRASFGDQRQLLTLQANAGGASVTSTLVGTTTDPCYIWPMTHGNISVVGNTVVGLTYFGSGASALEDVQVFAISFRASTPVAYPVADIITDQCAMAGITAGQIDVSTIDATLWGYTVSNPASVRANLQPLFTGYGLEAVDRGDGVLQFFRKSDIVSVGTVSFDELGAQSGDATTPLDPMPLSRLQDAELPASVALSYINVDFDYQTGTEIARRNDVDSVLEMTQELPISTNADHAATVAYRLLYEAWSQRNRRSIKVSRRFAYVLAGDGLTVEYPRGTQQLFLVLSANDTGALMEFELVPADATLYDQVAVGSTDYVPQAMALPPPPSRMLVLDIPPLTDADADGAGPYVAMDGYVDAWPGATLYVGNDDNSLAMSGTVAAEAPIGMVEDVLATFAGGATVDEANVLTVHMGNNELASIDRATLLRGQDNLAAIGAEGRWELVRFQTVTSLGDGRYTVTGFLRGLRGTEFAMGAHLGNDSFVLLVSGGLLKPAIEAGSIGATKRYRAVTLAAALSSASSQLVTITGEPLKPLSPVDPRKVRDITTGDLTLTWQRRSRLNGDGLMTLLPLGESSEAYDIEVYADSTFAALKRTTTVYSLRTWTYSAADQTTDFGAPQTTLSLRIYQLSVAIGRGHVLERTL